MTLHRGILGTKSASYFCPANFFLKNSRQIWRISLKVNPKNRPFWSPKGGSAQPESSHLVRNARRAHPRRQTRQAGKSTIDPKSRFNLSLPFWFFSTFLRYISAAYIKSINPKGRLKLSRLDADCEIKDFTFIKNGRFVIFVKWPSIPLGSGWGPER